MTTFAVLGVSLVVEGAALVFALRAAQQDAKGLPFGEYLKTKADPATLAALLEDSVAVLGLPRGAPHRSRGRAGQSARAMNASTPLVAAG